MKLKWSKGLSGWETSFGKWNISIQENGNVHISDSPYCFAHYPNFEAAAPEITKILLSFTIEEGDKAKRDFLESEYFKRIYGKFP